MEGSDEPDLSRQAAELRTSGFAGAASDRRERLQRSRARFYLGLLIFVVAAGLPMLAVPSLRHRLTERVAVLRRAVTGELSKPEPLSARIGENRGPFPKEYERPFKPLSPPQLTYRVGAGSDRVYESSEVLRAPSATGSASAEAGASSAQYGGEDASPAGASAPQFRQTKVEQEAYDILINSSEAIAGLVKGKDPSRRFKSWDAAKTEEDAFLVRLTFVKAPEGQEEQYIWQVKPMSRQVTPLSHNARALPK
jgi:hypothetical protein